MLTLVSLQYPLSTSPRLSFFACKLLCSYFKAVPCALGMPPASG
jgi:hypothetical protein